MAGSSLFALIDDITTVLDDVALMTKTATKKTAGVLGDDLALNAQQVSGVHTDRELPVVWAVAKGSLLNKAILVPAALLISAFIPWAITPLLMLGGAFLCYEGAEKILHLLLPHSPAETQHEQALRAAVADPTSDLVALEKEKIKGAIRTDFILSAEIIVISLGTIATATFGLQVAVLVSIALLMTVGVYGLVAGIIKLDDVGAYFYQPHQPASLRTFGKGLLLITPYLMRLLSILGTAAMFLVGGGILTHGFHGLSDWITQFAAQLNSPVRGLVTTLFDGLVGLLAGVAIVGVVTLAQKILKPNKSETA